MDFKDAKNRFIGSALALDDQIIAANSDNFLYSLNLSGQLQWTFESEHSLWGTPVSDGEIIYLPSMDHHVYALPRLQMESRYGKQMIWEAR